MTVPGAFFTPGGVISSAANRFHSFRAIGFDTPSATQPQSRKIFRFA
jgi:hypothetical protein